MGNCSDCSTICGKEGETGEFNMTVSLTILFNFPLRTKQLQVLKTALKKPLLSEQGQLKQQKLL